MGTTLHIKEALLYPESTRNLLSFKDIRGNDFHVETGEEDGREYLHITKRYSEARILEKLPSMSRGLYYTRIRALEVFTTLKTVFCSAELFSLWHDRFTLVLE